MSKVFFKKQKFFWAFFCAALAVICAAFGYACVAQRASVVYMENSVYFLALTDSRTEAGAEFSKLDGGAGYLLAEEKVVALSVYLQEKDGRAVAEEWRASGKEVRLLKKGGNALYFKGKQKEKQWTYVGALRTLKGCLLVLEGCISQLEKGMTQEGCKRLLSVLKKQLSYAGKTYIEYEKFSVVCIEAVDALAQIEKGIVYLQDLRHLLCWQAEKYVELCEEFSL